MPNKTEIVFKQENQKINIPDWIYQINSEIFKQYSDLGYTKEQDKLDYIINQLGLYDNEKDKKSNKEQFNVLLKFLKKPVAECDSDDIFTAEINDILFLFKTMEPEDLDTEQHKLVENFQRDIKIKATICQLLIDLENVSGVEYVISKPYNNRYGYIYTWKSLEENLEKLQKLGVDFVLDDKRMSEIKNEAALKGVKYFREKCQTAFNPEEINGLNKEGSPVGLYQSLISNAEIAKIDISKTDDLELYIENAKTRTIADLSLRMSNIASSDIYLPARRIEIGKGFTNSMLRLGYFTKTAPFNKGTTTIEIVEMINKIKSWENTQDIKSGLDIISDCLIAQEIIFRAEISDYNSIKGYVEMLNKYKEIPVIRPPKNDYEESFIQIDDTLLKPILSMLQLVESLPSDVENSLKINIENLKNAAQELGYIPETSLKLISDILDKLNGVAGPNPKFLNNVPKKLADVKKNETLETILDRVPDNRLKPQFIIQKNKDLLKKFSSDPGFDIDKIRELITKNISTDQDYFLGILGNVEIFLKSDILKVLELNLAFINEFIGLKNGLISSKTIDEPYLDLLKSIANHLSTKKDIIFLLRNIQQLSGQPYLYNTNGNSLQDEIADLAYNLRVPGEVEFEFGFEYDDFLQEKAREGVNHFNQNCLEAKNPFEITHKTGFNDRENGFYPALRANSRYLGEWQSVPNRKYFLDRTKNKVIGKFQEGFKDLSQNKNQNPKESRDVVRKLQEFLGYNNIPPSSIIQLNVRSKEDLDQALDLIRSWDLDRKTHDQLDIIAEFAYSYRISSLLGLYGDTDRFNLNRFTNKLNIDTVDDVKWPIQQTLKRIKDNLEVSINLPNYITDELTKQLEILKTKQNLLNEEIISLTDKIAARLSA